MISYKKRGNGLRREGKRDEGKRGEGERVWQGQISLQTNLEKWQKMNHYKSSQINVTNKLRVRVVLESSVSVVPAQAVCVKNPKNVTSPTPSLVPRFQCSVTTPSPTSSLLLHFQLPLNSSLHYTSHVSSYHLMVKQQPVHRKQLQQSNRKKNTSFYLTMINRD